MGLEKIKEEILRKATDEEKAILLEAQQKAQALKKETESHLKELEKESAKKVKAEMKSLENKELSIAESHAQKLVFEAKKKALDQAYHETLQKIRKMPKKDREPIIQSMMKNAAKEIEVGAVLCNDVDKTFVEGTTTKTLETDGGIVCETEDGRVRVDYTFASVFSEVKEKTLQKASKMLFN